MNKSDLIKEWIEYSKRDLESAKYLTGMRPEPFEIICFHCQQSDEKSLKAVIYKQNIRPPRTHDIDELITLCNLPVIEKLRESLSPLNDYSVMVRYPTNESVEKQDVQQALQAAEECLDVILEELKGAF